jgi:hypothetical protein
MNIQLKLNPNFRGILLILLTPVMLCTGQVTSDQPVGINSSNAAPHAAAGLDVDYTNKGFLPPRLNSAQRSTIPSPVPAGLTIYNTDVNCLQFYNGSVWICGGMCSPSAPTAGSHTATGTQITWVWNAVSGASGYKYNTSNTYSSATDLGNTLSYIQTGLTSNTPYTLYVWAYNECGASSSVTLSQSTPFVCGTTTVTANHAPADGVSPVTRTVTYNSVSFSSECWIDRNLGAVGVATLATDNSESNAGWYWQFNRKQGRQNTGGTNNTPAWSISTITENSDWTAAQDPCTIVLGAGWRLPTNAEWTAADAGWNGYADTYASPLKLHAAGRVFDNGTLDSRGLYGGYWSGTQSTTALGIPIDFGPGFSYMAAWPKASGFTLRCLRN